MLGKLTKEQRSLQHPHSISTAKSDPSSLHGGPVLALRSPSWISDRRELKDREAIDAAGEAFCTVGTPQQCGCLMVPAPAVT